MHVPPLVHGVPLETVSWGELPAEIAGLAQRKAEKDPVVAAHVTDASEIAVLRVTGDQAVTLTIPGASNRHTVLFVDVAPHCSLTVHEILKSATNIGSTSTRLRDSTELVEVRGPRPLAFAEPRFGLRPSMPTRVEAPLDRELGVERRAQSSRGARSGRGGRQRSGVADHSNGAPGARPWSSTAMEDVQREASGASWASVLLLVSVGAGGRVQWFGQSMRAPGFTFVERLAVLAQDAVLEHHSALVAANAIRENIHVVLAAPGATAQIRSLFVGGGDPTSPDGLPTSPPGLRGAGHQFDLGVTAEHRAPHTTSDLRAKGALTGRAQGVYRGLVRIGKSASGADGYQRCDTLLLSRTAEVDPIPNLEIETNDVRCTHGVTVSHMDPEHLFYLQSRGLSPEAARQLLVEGFVGDILRTYPDTTREEIWLSARETLQEPS